MGLEDGTGAGGGGGGGASGGGTAGIQFDTVEGASPDAGRACARCQRRIEDEYFEIGGNVVCRACSVALTGGTGGTGPFLRALVYGGGAALLGAIVWYLIIKISDYELGLIAIGVGLIVGIAVRKGSGGRGGWKYQLLAMALTYGAVTVSKVPLVIQAIAAHGDEKDEADGKDDKSGGASAAEGAKGDPAQAGGAQAAAGKPAEPVGAGGFVVGLLLIVGIALASPFLAGASNIMGIIIIGIALYEAWKINKRVPVNGPFRFAPAVQAAAPVLVAPGPGAPPSSMPPGS